MIDSKFPGVDLSGARIAIRVHGLQRLRTDCNPRPWIATMAGYRP